MSACVARSTSRASRSQARGVYNTESRKVDPIGSLLVSDRWQTGIGEIGALINASFTQTRYLNSIRYQGFQDNVPANQQILPASVGRNFTFPQDIGLYYRRGNRQRPSVNGSIQWKPADNLMIYLDGLYQGYRDRVANDFSASRSSPIPMAATRRRSATRC